MRHRTNDSYHKPVYVMRSGNYIYFYIDEITSQPDCFIHSNDVNKTYITKVATLEGDYFTDKIYVKKDGGFWTMNVEVEESSFCFSPKLI